MDEFQFIESIKPKSYKQASLLKGIGDDAAVFKSNMEDTVVAVDTFVENVHFSKITTEPFHIGYRALAANISDMAAMGALPRFYLVSIVIPSSVDKRVLQEIFAGMNDLATRYGMDLIGGDTVSGEQLMISITIIGTVAKEKVRYRSDAKHNDIVFVTGTLGDARAGLYALLHNEDIVNKRHFVQAHQMPEPRVTFANGLHEINRMALNDISDGIANELHEIANASGVTITIDDDKIPVHLNFSQFTTEQQFEWKYFGGEDFEIVGTTSMDNWHRIEKIADSLALPVTIIGDVTYNEKLDGQVFLRKGDQIEPLKKMGYTHIKRVK